MIRLQSSLGHIPGPTPNPLFGNIFDVFKAKAYGKAIQQHVPKYGDIFTFYGFLPEVVLSHPDYIKMMYLHSNERGADLSQPIAETAKVLGLFSLPYGDKWKFYRRLVSPIFQSSNLQKIDWIIVEKVKKLADRWRKLAATNGGQVEVNSLTEFQNMTVDAVGKAAFGYDFNALDGNSSELLSAFDLILSTIAHRIIFNLIPYWKWLPFLPANARLHKAQQLAVNTMARMIEERVADYVKEKAAGQLKEEGLDLMDLLLRASQDNEDGKFSIEDLYGECFTFVVAGNETTAISLTFLFNLLGNNLEEQSKLREHIRKAIGDKSPTINDLNNIPYLEMAIKESMRLFPVAYINRREAQEDMKFGEYVNPKGTSLIYSAQHAHSDERFWQEPQKFNPERFSREEEEKRPLHSFVPFGGGLRICVGKTFAMSEMKFTTALLLREFEFDSRKHGITDTVQEFVMKPSNPCPCTVRPL
jgi:cytochrome P450